MIRGLGIDLVEIDRISHSLQRFGQRFVEKVFNPAEERSLVERGLLGAAESGTGQEAQQRTLASAVAARFAAKEAAVKALGTGFACGIGMHHIEVRSLPSGQPEVLFHGPAAQRMAELGATRAHLSLTHSRDSAAAVVILEE